MRLVLKLLVASCVLLVAASGAVVWRLSRGPVSLTPIQPLVQALIDRGSPYAVSFSRPSLVWLTEDEQDVLALEVHDAALRTPDGKLLASAPLVQTTVPIVPLLLEWRIELVEAKLGLPEIQLSRDPSGRLVLSFAGQLAAVPLGAAGTGGGLSTILGDSGEVADARLEALRLVRVTAPTLRYLDEVTGDAVAANDAVFDLERAGTIWRASLGAKLGQGSFKAQGAPTATPAQQDVTVELQRLQPKDFAAFAPQLPLSGLAVPVTGTLRFPVDALTAARGPARIDMAVGAGEIAVTTLGLAPIPIRDGELHANVDAGWMGAQIDRFELAAEGFALGLRGRVAQTDGKLAADLKLQAEQLDVSDVLALWPTSLGGDARAWVVANVPAGQVSGATVNVGGEAARPGQPQIGGTFAFAGAEVRYLATMPPATGLAGSASLAGNSFAFKLNAGKTGEVDLRRGKVMLSNVLGEGITQLHVDADIGSTIPAAMRLLDAEPVELRRATGLSAERAAGTQATNFELHLPLLADIPPSRIHYKASSRLSDVELRDLSPGYSLAASSLALVAEPAGVGVKGDARVNGVPLNADFRENTPPIKGVKRTIRVLAAIDAPAARSLNFAWPEAIGGPVWVDATMTEARNPLRTVELLADLRRAVVSLPQLVIHKRAGDPGTMTARVVQPDERSLSIERARLDVAGWSAEGEVGLRLDPVRPNRIALRQLRGPLGDVAGNLTSDGQRWRGRVDIGRLDLRPALQGGSAGGGGGLDALPDFQVEVTARQLRLGDAPFSNLAGSVERRRKIWYAAKLRGNIEDSEVRLDVDTPTHQTAAILRGSDAGWLIRGFSASDNGIRGGTFRLSADLTQGGAEVTGNGELKIRDFTLWGAPTIARIVSLASFSGISNALGGQGVPVQRLVAPFGIDGESITLQQARLVGSNIGARADGTIDFGAGRLNVQGTVAPAYTVNRVLGRIPIIGQILSGSRSDAALAATFSVSGAMGSPQISVNPLSVLVPGMIRDLFSAFTADDDQGGRIDER